ncbi:ATP-binding protein [Methylosinus sp. Sm6]|uniref:nucleotide-binding protein n=1 Tax=Methylosinus sp. Sm6 TaxID=2866948 RepID=UPI001C99505F|nr:ATP-binding protein [Methylosinus sp. Sm6]MBY6241258.1 ATP-binding protein [Methylosinus sp. Sm6]
MLASPLVLVGADKGGVGKTTVTRLLIDFLQASDFDVRVFDAQAPSGTLRRFYPNIAKLMDMRDIRDQARLVESLASHQAVTVVDLKSGQLLHTLRFMEDVGLLDASARSDARILVLHLIGASVASLAELEAVAPYKNKCEYRIVKNFVNGSSFFDDNADFSEAYLRRSDAWKEIVVPRLDRLAYEAVELTGLPFSSFVFDEPARGPETRPRSFVLRGYVRTWLERSWTNFETAGLRSFLAPLGQKQQLVASG